MGGWLADLAPDGGGWGIEAAVCVKATSHSGFSGIPIAWLLYI